VPDSWVCRLQRVPPPKMTLSAAVPLSSGMGAPLAQSLTPAAMERNRQPRMKRRLVTHSDWFCKR
jgi:hypothetical protein